MSFKRFTPFVFPSLILLVFLFSIYGFHQSLGEKFNLWSVLFATLNFFIMNDADPIQLSDNVYILIAKYIAAVIVGFGLFSLSYKYLHKLYLSYKIRYSFKDHIIIFSLDQAGKNIAEQLIKNKYPIVIVEQDANNPFIEDIENLGCLVFTDSPFERSTFDKIAISKAKLCILAHTKDETNIQIASRIIEHMGSIHNNKLTSNFSALKIYLLVDEMGNMDVINDYFDINNKDEHYDLFTFNIDQLAAQRLFDTHTPIKYISSQGEDSENAIAIIGCNKTAEAFIIENLILSHFVGRPQLKIYLVDKEVEKFYHDFKYQYPFCDEFIDLIPVKLLNASFFGNFAWSKEHIEKLSKIPVAYFFGDIDSVVIQTASAFRQFLYIQTLSASKVPFIITLQEESGIYQFLNENTLHINEVDQLFTKKLNMHFVKRQSDAFSGKNMIDEGEITDALARIINFYYSVSYEFENILKEKFNINEGLAIVSKLTNYIIEFPLKNSEYTEFDFENSFMQYLYSITDIEKEKLYDSFSIKKRWNVLNNRKKDSNRYAARNIESKFIMMKEIGCWPINSENILKYYPRLAEVEHKRWSAEKLIVNYKFGPFSKDKNEKYVLKEILKIHDQLIPFNNLTEEEKQKDLNLFLLLPLLYLLKQPIDKQSI